MPEPTILDISSLPPNNATYSQAVRLGDVIYLSGQLGVRRDGTLPGVFQDEVRQALDTIATVLHEAGSAMSLVAKVNIFITDFTLLGEMNQVYAQYFPHRPAKTTVEIARLDKGARIEVEVVAGARSAKTI